MGRKPKLTPEEKKEKRRKSNKAYYEKINSDPVLKKENIKKQVEANAKYKSKMTEEQKQREREYQRNYQKQRRAMLKQIQLKVSSEQSAEIGIQKKASPTEVKKIVHSPV